MHIKSPDGTGFRPAQQSLDREETAQSPNKEMLDDGPRRCPYAVVNASEGQKGQLSRHRGTGDI